MADPPEAGGLARWSRSPWWSLGWFAVLSTKPTSSRPNATASRGSSSDYRNKLAQAVNLAELRKQKLQVQEYVTQLEKQLPGKAEMDALLSDINQAGSVAACSSSCSARARWRSRTTTPSCRSPIKVTGRYHDIGSFAADVANLSRIVTLHDLNIAAQRRTRRQRALAMDATARTYRYLDPAEVMPSARLPR